MSFFLSTRQLRCKGSILTFNGDGYIDAESQSCPIDPMKNSLSTDAFIFF